MRNSGYFNENQSQHLSFTQLLHFSHTGQTDFASTIFRATYGSKFVSEQDANVTRRTNTQQTFYIKHQNIPHVSGNATLGKQAYPLTRKFLGCEFPHRQKPKHHAPAPRRRPRQRVLKT